MHETQAWRTRHRGPYRMLAVRPGKRPGSATTEWLPGLVDSDDVEAEALALVADRRDTITHVDVWSDREQQFVMTYRQPKGWRVNKEAQ